jgi:MFS family permease
MGRATTPTRGPFAFLLGANAISLLGNQFTVVAIPWLVLELTGSAAKAGLTAFATTLPLLFAAAFGGALVDRLGCKWISVATDLLSALAVAAVPLLARTHELAFWHLLGLVAGRALLTAPGVTARQALLPDLAARSGVGRERANATAQGLQQGALLLGPPLAGLAIAASGPTVVLWVDAATFALSAGLVGAGVPSARRADTARIPGRYLAELRDGLRFVRRQRLLRALFATGTGVNVLTVPFFAVLLPVYVREQYGSAAALGLLLSGVGGAALLGTLLYGLAGHRLPRRPCYIGALFVSGMPFWVLALTPPLGVALGALGVLGLAIGPLNPLIQTVVQERTPPALRGRVFGLLLASGLAAAPLGALLVGAALAIIGLRSTLLALAAVYLAITFAVPINPAFRALDTPAGDDTAEPPPSDEVA